MRKTANLLILISALALAGCPGNKPADTYTDKNGNTTLIESDHEMCVRSCNEDYSRCMDTQPAQTNEGVNGPRGMFGASADCRNNLRDCLPGCQAR